MSAYETIVKTVDTLIKEPKQAAKVANAIFTDLDNGGWFTTDNDHLAMMRTALKRIHTLVMDEECSARDTAALTNRLQQFSAEVTTMEEKQKQEGKIRGNNNTDKASSTFDPGSV